MTIQIGLYDKDDQVRSGKNDYEENQTIMMSKGKKEVILSTQWLEYNKGDYYEIKLSDPCQFIVVQLDITLPPTLIYIKGKKWTYIIPNDDNYAESLSDSAFKSKKHFIFARYAESYEIERYQNLTYNPHDLNKFNGAYPHASANVETRNDSTFFAKNAIDGVYANTSHGSYPYQSWGINQQSDAELTIEFGHKVKIDLLELTLRADFPQDSYWTEGNAVFSDGTEVTMSFEKTSSPQNFKINEITTEWIKLNKLIKNKDDSPFPALTQLSAYGTHVLEFY